MNIENLYSMLSSLRQFTNLLKQDMSLETLNIIRELKGFEVLENYEKMFEVDIVNTKNVLRNYIINEINSLTTGIVTIGSYDNDVIKEHIDSKLKLPNIDSGKIKLLIEKLQDEDALNLVTHKLSLGEYLERLTSDSKYISILSSDEDIKVKFEDIIDTYEAMLKIIEKSENGSDVIKVDIVSNIYGFGLDRDTTVSDLKDYILTLDKDINKVTNNLESVISNIKDNIKNVDYKETLAKTLKENIMKSVDEYSKGVISLDTFEYLTFNQIEVMEYYTRIILAYIGSITSYTENVVTCVNVLNDIDNIINVSCELFAKSE